MRLGFERIGGRCVFTSEWNKYSQITYKGNFVDEDHPVAGDIREVASRSIPDHDVLLAGFPCQPFSIAGVSKKNSLGRPHGFACDTQGTLFFEIQRIIAEKQPIAFLLENVKNLERHDRGRTFKTIQYVLEDELGYCIDYRVIDARHFVPQHRERIFIVGFRKASSFRFSDLSLPPGPAPVLKSVLHGFSAEEEPEAHYTVQQRGKTVATPRYTLSDKLWQYLQDYAAKHRAKGNGFGFGLVGPESVARTLSARYHKDGSEILIDQGRNRNPRRLTPRECARLMGFPADYKIPVSDTQAYRQFGNAVVVPVIERVAEHMLPHILEQMRIRDGVTPAKARSRRRAKQLTLLEQ